MTDRNKVGGTALVDTVITDWSLIRLSGTDNVTVLWGIVAEDPSGRWRPGDYVCTSPVAEELAEGVFRTRNSLYQALGEGQWLVLPAQHLPCLRAGRSPGEVWALIVAGAF